MTIPEVLIGTMVLGIILAVMSAAVIVILHQQNNTTGRLNNARSEQGVGIYMPADLASSETVDTSPGASPCGTSCPASVSSSLGGSNALMLSWTTQEPGVTAPVISTTNVSYRYVQVGTEFQLIRVACTSVAGGPWSCNARVVLHDLDAPPAGQPWVPGSTAPTWVIQVSQPLDPGDTGTPGTTVPVDPNLPTKNARRVVVTINGGGDAPGAGGGTNQISLSAGGTTRKTIDASSLDGTPSFTAARSRCGGNVALIVDESGSIGSSITQVESAVAAFVTAFAGTPVKLQITRFDTKSSVLGTTGWSRYFDMLNDADVAELQADVPQLRSSGGTNWEDGWFRTFYNSNGTVQSVIPDLVVFFTDGVPTYSRVNSTSATAPITPPARLGGYPSANGSAYNQEAWYRANVIATEFRSSVKFIGVGVGPDVSNSSSWITSVPGWHYLYERAYHYERGFHYERAYHYQRGFHYERAFHYEKKISGTWTVVDQATYNAASPSNRRIVYASPYQYWEATDLTGYNAAASAGRRTVYTSAPYDQWEDTDAAGYAAAPTAGKRFSYTSPYSYWENTDATGYNAAASAGRRMVYATPYDQWEQTDLNGYNAVTDPNGKRFGYTSPYTYWETIDQTTYNATASADRRATKIYTPPYDSYDAPVTTSVLNSTIITRLIAGNDFGVPAIYANGKYTNPDQANMYVLPNWSQFTGALQAVALAECGGTLTLQTKVGTSPAGDPFTYQNTAITDSTGAALGGDKTVVTTTPTYVSGTFDFTITNGAYVDVDIQPANLSDLTGYQPGSWSCKAGAANRSFTTFPIAGSTWVGIHVRVAANEAVSCTQTVTRVGG